MIRKERLERMNRLSRRTAFTLMEMLVVVAIIVVLAGVGGAYMIGRLNEAKVDTARIKAKTISDAIEQYQAVTGTPPGSLEVLLQKDAEGRGPWLKNIDALKDPWDHVFQYDPTGQENARTGTAQGITIADVYCVTPDGRKVGNWKEPKQ